MRCDKILAKAQKTVLERGDTYGPPGEGFATIARLWSVTLGQEVAAWQVAICMGQLKEARLIHADGDHPDSWVDLAGYAACGGEINGG